jgi:alpha-L-fucosidase 2
MVLQPKFLPLIMSALGILASGKSFDNVQYSAPDGVSLHMDGYVPDGPGPFPAAVIVHGGAWVTGDRKRSVQPLFAPLTSAGIAWFSIDYRLADFDFSTLGGGAAALTRVSAAVDDVRQAVIYVRTHAAEFQVDPNRIAIIGESAGAQLAAMAALQPGLGGVVQAAVAFYCPSDLVSLVQTNPQIPDSIRQMLAASPFGALLTGALRNLSPLNFITRNAPPFLLIHGTADRLVPYQQSVEMRDALQKAGDSAQIYTVQGGGHGVRWWESKPELTGYKQQMVRWLKEKLGS